MTIHECGLRTDTDRETRHRERERERERETERERPRERRRVTKRQGEEMFFDVTPLKYDDAYAGWQAVHP